MAFKKCVLSPTLFLWRCLPPPNFEAIYFSFKLVYIYYYLSVYSRENLPPKSGFGENTGDNLWALVDLCGLCAHFIHNPKQLEILTENFSWCIQLKIHLRKTRRTLRFFHFVCFLFLNLLSCSEESR